MKPDHSQTTPSQPHLNLLSHSTLSQHNPHQGNMTQDSLHYQNQMDGMLSQNPFQQCMNYFPTSSAGQQYNIQGNQQYSHKQPMNYPHYQTQQNLNNGIANKNYQQQNKLTKGINNNNNNNNYNSMLSGNNSNGNNTTTMRAGDWICLICSNLNFSFRNECNRCKMQTKQQNFLQNLMMYSQDKAHMNFSYQIGVPTPQQINYEVSQQQQQQQFLQQMQQHQLQQQQQQPTQPNSLGIQLQQPFIPLLKQNSIKRDISDKENKEPSTQMGASSILGGQMTGRCMKSQNNNSQYNQKQDLQNMNNPINNNCGNVDTNTSYYFNQPQYKECLNVNTPQFYYPHQSPKNNNFKDLKQSQQQQQQYLQIQHQQLFNSSQSILPNQNFKQNFQLNQTQFPFQSQHFQQSDLNYQPVFAPNSVPSPLSQSTQSEIQHQHQFNVQTNQLSNQTEFYQQKIYSQNYKQQLNQMHQQNGNQALNINKAIPQPQLAQNQNIHQNEFQQQLFYTNQQSLHLQHQQQFYQDQVAQRGGISQFMDDGEYSNKQQVGQNGFMRDNQGIQQFHQYPNINGRNSQINNNNSQNTLNCDQECFFDNQMSLNDLKFENQKNINQFEQQTSYFSLPVNFLKNNQVIQPHHHSHYNNNNAIQYPQQHQIHKSQLYRIDSNNMNEHLNNSNLIQPSQQLLPSSDGTNITPNSYQTLDQTPFECFGKVQDNNNQISKQDQQNSLNLWSGPQKGFENRLLVTPPKAKQFMQSKQQLSDIENMISQFKLMYSTEKKSQSKGIYSNNNSEHCSIQGNSTQKECRAIVASSQGLSRSDSQIDNHQNLSSLADQDQRYIQKIQQQSTNNDSLQFVKEQSSKTPLKSLKKSQLTTYYEEKPSKTESTPKKFSTNSQQKGDNERNLEIQQIQLWPESKSERKNSIIFNETTDKNQATQENTKFKQQVDNYLVNRNSEKYNKENINDLETKENQGLSECAINLSSISTQVLSKQGTTERDDKHIFTDDIFTSPLDGHDYEQNTDVQQDSHAQSNNQEDFNEFQINDKDLSQRQNNIQKSGQESDNLNSLLIERY